MRHTVAPNWLEGYIQPPQSGAALAIMHASLRAPAWPRGRPQLVRLIHLSLPVDTKRLEPVTLL